LERKSGRKININKSGKKDFTQKFLREMWAVAK